MRRILFALTAAALTTPAAAQFTPHGKASPDTTKYCFQVEPSTGSLVRRTECRTKADWALRWVDVDGLLRK